MLTNLSSLPCCGHAAIFNGLCRQNVRNSDQAKIVVQQLFNNQLDYCLLQLNQFSKEVVASSACESSQFLRSTPVVPFGHVCKYFVWIVSSRFTNYL